jgi:hypothetical protein
MISPRQISLFTEEQLTSSQEDSHVSPTQWQESDLAKKMNATYGQRCLEQFEKFNRHGSWAKMFSGLLIGMEGWYSTRCKLTWKLKGTKFNRMYFQLVPSTLPTEGTEFGLLPTPNLVQIAETPEKYQERQKKRTEDGLNQAPHPNNKYNCLLSQVLYSGLLKTPTKMDGEVTSGKKNPISGNSGTLAQEIMSKYPPTMKKLGLIPTPTSVQRDHPERVEELKKIGAKTIYSRENGEKRPNSIIDYMSFHNMLPTPTTRDWKGAQANEYKEMRGEETEYKMQSLPGLAMKGILPTPSAFDWNTAQRVDKYEERKQMQSEKGVNLHYPLKQMEMDINPTGTTSQLSPQFVLEMMGFPTDWTLLPFQNGETNQSKQEETQSYHK